LSKTIRSGSAQAAGARIRSFRRHHDRMGYGGFPSARIGLFSPEMAFGSGTGNATMTGEGDGDDRPAGASAKSSKDSKRDTRQDRLKLALRQNLKRRKSQARGRDNPAATSSDVGEAASCGERDKADRG
jgi:hypothetical protein